MTAHPHDSALIIGGYSRQLADGFFALNDGLHSRFPEALRFEFIEFGEDELLQILQLFCANSEHRLSLSAGASAAVLAAVSERDWCNAREMENLLPELRKARQQLHIHFGLPYSPSGTLHAVDVSYALAKLDGGELRLRRDGEYEGYTTGEDVLTDPSDRSGTIAAAGSTVVALAVSSSRPAAGPTPDGNADAATADAGAATAVAPPCSALGAPVRRGNAMAEAGRTSVPGAAAVSEREGQVAAAERAGRLQQLQLEGQQCQTAEHERTIQAELEIMREGMLAVRQEVASRLAAAEAQAHSREAAALAEAREARAELELLRAASRERDAFADQRLALQAAQWRATLACVCACGFAVASWIATHSTPLLLLRAPLYLGLASAALPIAMLVALHFVAPTLARALTTAARGLLAIVRRWPRLSISLCLLTLALSMLLPALREIIPWTSLGGRDTNGAGDECTLRPADLQLWGEPELAAWLGELGLGRHTSKFVHHAIDASLLPSLTSAELAELGMGLVGERLALLEAIGELAASSPRGSPSHVPSRRA